MHAFRLANKQSHLIFLCCLLSAPHHTTGNSDFTVCHRHSAKTKKIIGKRFAECNTRQTAHDIYSADKRLFAECFLLGTRQRLCRELKPTLSEKSHVTERRRSRRIYRVSNLRHSANIPNLLSVKF